MTHYAYDFAQIEHAALLARLSLDSFDPSVQYTKKQIHNELTAANCRAAAEFQTYVAKNGLERLPWFKLARIEDFTIKVPEVEIEPTESETANILRLANYFNQYNTEVSGWLINSEHKIMPKWVSANSEAAKTHKVISVRTKEVNAKRYYYTFVVDDALATVRYALDVEVAKKTLEHAQAYLDELRSRSARYIGRKN